MSVNALTLQKIIQSGYTSPFLEARVQYAEAATLLNQHLRKLEGLDRVYPTMVPAQSSGRVGISDPPLGNFTADKRYGPKGFRDVIQPDLGTIWVCPDYNAIEMEIVCHRGQAPNNEEIRLLGLDRHTVNAIRTFKYPDPEGEPTKEWLRSEAGMEWRLACGFNDNLRLLIKNCQYTLQYAHGDLNGRHAERALGVYAAKMGLKAPYLYQVGKQFLQANPWLVAFKRQRWAEAWRKKEARTSFGRRRRLIGPRINVETDGLNHEVQGTVADIMKMTMVAIENALPECYMVLQRHDGWYTSVPETFTQHDEYFAIVEREWLIDDRPISFKTEWEIWKNGPAS